MFCFFVKFKFIIIDINNLKFLIEDGNVPEYILEDLCFDALISRKVSISEIRSFGLCITIARIPSNKFAYSIPENDSPKEITTESQTMASKQIKTPKIVPKNLTLTEEEKVLWLERLKFF